MTENPDLALWQRIVAEPVVGACGHRLTYAAGPAHPSPGAPAWVTPAGASLQALHGAYLARRMHDHRGEDVECATSPARPRGAA